MVIWTVTFDWKNSNKSAENSNCCIQKMSLFQSQKLLSCFEVDYSEVLRKMRGELDRLHEKYLIKLNEQKVHLRFIGHIWNNRQTLWKITNWFKIFEKYCSINSSISFRNFSVDKIALKHILARKSTIGICMLPSWIPAKSIPLPTVVVVYFGFPNELFLLIQELPSNIAWHWFWDSKVKIYELIDQTSQEILKNFLEKPLDWIAVPHSFSPHNVWRYWD